MTIHEQPSGQPEPESQEALEFCQAFREWAASFQSLTPEGKKRHQEFLDTLTDGFAARREAAGIDAPTINS